MWEDGPLTKTWSASSNMKQMYNRPLVSPLHERPFPYKQNTHTLTSKESHGVDKLSHYSSRQHQGNGWKVPQPLSPMYDHKNGPQEIPIPKVGDIYQTRQDNTQKPPREQLPPLSSLFGSASSQSRPAQSPYSDRQSPVFPTAPQNDGRHPATRAHSDRSYDASYFQRPPASRQYSHGSRQEHVERLGIPPPPRPGSLGLRPESPRYESSPGVMEVPRPHVPGSVNGWSPHSQSSRSEYFSRDTSSSFRPHLDHHSQQLTIHRHEPEARQAYRTPGPATYPSTPASIVSGDVATSKDGLGPKIWTGTQFLPRFVRQAEVPGEGMCYFYDDGTHCKTVIDGEVVNAHWGVTKAGKPRKRLAIACITCREKKIKCDPDYPRCVQCEKFGRICKFKNAPRGGQGSPDTPPADPEDIVPRPTSSRTEGESFRSEKRESTQSISPRQVMRPGTPESETHHSKRQRTGYNDFTPVASEASPRPSMHEAASPSIPWMESIISTPMDSNLSRDWQTNPFTTHPALVAELMNVFFKHVPETAYCMFPEGPFTAWVLSHSEKSVDDLMLIYTILALGTVFSLNPEHKPLGVQYAAISRYACDTRHFTIQLVQSRLLLALYYFAINNPNDAWDFCGSALRAASGLKMNLEMEKTDDSYLQTFPYGLNRSGYAESRRRTFWSCYIMDRFNGFCSGHLSVIHPEDVFLRLPCDFKYFESQTDVQTPFFDVTTPALQASDWTIGSMAYLINISTIWGDVMANIYRTAQRPIPFTSNSTFVTFYDTITQRLNAWRDSLPSSYTFSSANLKIATDSGKLGTFMTMHVVYYTAAMKLNRYIQKSTFSLAQLDHHVSLSKQHAESLLAVMEALARSRSPPLPSPAGHNVVLRKFSSPFVGYSIVSAIDILSARFSLSSVPALLQSFQGAQSILGELALFWQSGRNQHLQIQQRLRDIANATTTKEEQDRSNIRFGLGRETDGIFKMRDPIEKTFSRDYDCLYA